MPPELDASRAAMLVAALEQGNYFDSRTSSLTLRVAAFNPKLRLLSYATAQFTWNADGSISFSASIPETVPAYTPSLGKSLPPSPSQLHSKSGTVLAFICFFPPMLIIPCD
jgi:hypothetical protein